MTTKYQPHNIKRKSPVDRIAIGYISALLWSENIGGDNEVMADSVFDQFDFSSEAMDAIKKDCQTLWDNHYELIDDDNFTDATDCIYEQAGHDLLLTRNDHGVGFWEPEWINGKPLDEFAKSLGEANLYSHKEPEHERANDDGYVLEYTSN